MNTAKKLGRGFGSSVRPKRFYKSIDLSEHAGLEQDAALLIDQGRLVEAEVIYRKLISLDTANYLTYSSLAVICAMSDRFGESVSLLKRALELNPNDPSSHNCLGNALQEQGALKEAIASYQIALQLDSAYIEARHNLANALQKYGDLDASIVCYQQVLDACPDNIDCCLNLGNALSEKGDLELAVVWYEKAIYLSPEHALAYCNLGNLFARQGSFIAANSMYRKAIELNPGFPDALCNLSHLLLLNGDYSEGWCKYESRSMKAKPDLPHANPSLPLWDGKGLESNDHLLIVSEQGLGDTLQFMRYLIELNRRGVKTSFCVQDKLHGLIQVSGIDSSPLSLEQAIEVKKGHWIPLLSLPKKLGVSPEKPIIIDPYISTKDILVEKWCKRLDAESSPVVGINWQGNPVTETEGLKGRSLSLEAFAPLAVSKAKLLSLQQGFGSEQLETCSFKDRFVSCQDQVTETWDFLETAAIIANCDLVITSDTSVAHLAGGMGRRTWLLLQKVPDWRWGLEGDTTFWYPSMRLFRQRERGNWNEVMIRVALELDKFLSDKKHLVFQEP